jgi:hypothetical protein
MHAAPEIDGVTLLERCTLVNRRQGFVDETYLVVTHHANKHHQRYDYPEPEGQALCHCQLASHSVTPELFDLDKELRLPKEIDFLLLKVFVN